MSASQPARILIAFYSRNGHTGRLAEVLAEELTRRGHHVEREVIRPVREWNRWLLPIPLLPLLPLLPLYLASASFRRLWHRIYPQPRQTIRPLCHPDVSGFDHVLIGTPKWLYIAFPVAQWLDTIDGLKGTPVSPFATFCGPPLQVFELDMLFLPLRARLAARGAVLGSELAVSSDYHPYFFFGEMRALFRWLSRRCFARPLDDFTLDGPIGQAALQRYCDDIDAAVAARR